LAATREKTNEALSGGGFLNIQGLATLVVFILIFVFLSIASPSFLTMQNLIGLVRQVALLCIAAVGMTFLIIAGGIDLSIGSSNAVTGVLCALVVSKLGFPTPLARPGLRGRDRTHRRNRHGRHLSGLLLRAEKDQGQTVHVRDRRRPNRRPQGRGSTTGCTWLSPS
jgi:hypothetical protein